MRTNRGYKFKQTSPLGEGEREEVWSRDTRERRKVIIGGNSTCGRRALQEKEVSLSERGPRRERPFPSTPTVFPLRPQTRASTYFTFNHLQTLLTHSLSSYRLSSSPLTPFFQNCPRLLSSKYSKFFSIRRGRRFLEQSATEKEDRESILFIFRFRRVSLQREREKEREEIISVKKIFMYISEVFDYIEILRDFDYVSCSSNCIFLKKRLLVLKK